MRIGPLTQESIDQVFKNLSSISLESVEAFGLSFHEMREGFVNMVHKPWAVSLCSNDGEPCAVLIMTPLGPKMWRVYFADAEGKLGLISVGMTKFLREISDTIIKDGGCIEALSAYGNGKPRKWFETLGFKQAPQNGDKKIFRYMKGDHHGIRR
jgi:hypothetical protein